MAGKLEGGRNEDWPATIAQRRERVTEPVPAEDDGSQYGLIGTPDQYEELPFEGDES